MQTGRYIKSRNELGSPSEMGIHSNVSMSIFVFIYSLTVVKHQTRFTIGIILHISFTSSPFRPDAICNGPFSFLFDY